jgi:O-antigen/teichoic acid export membrane protein
MQKKTGYRGVIKRNTTPIFSFINLSFVQGSNALIQILLIPIITRIVGLSEFGLVMLAGSYAALVSLFINYGSNQSGVKDVSIHRSNNKVLSETFYSIYLVRLLFFAITFLIMLLMDFASFQYAKYFLLANAIILAETLNPIFFFVGIQKLFLYNIVNLISKICSALLIILLITSPANSEWVNFYLGITSVVGNLALCIYLIKKYRLYHYKISIPMLGKYLKQNFYLTGNNISVQLQQSFFLFAVSRMGNSLLLGAYSLSDKIVWSFRLLIISFFNAIYPKAVSLYEADPEVWKRFRKKINILLFVVFVCAAILLFLLSDFIVLIISGQHNPLASTYIKSICFVPLIAALNSVNVIDLLMRDKYRYIFIIALILLGVSIIVAEIFVAVNNSHFFGYYPIIVEIFSLPLYMYFINRSSNP